MTGAGRITLAGVAAACALAVAPVAQAGVSRPSFSVSPATASTSSPITATWKVDRRLKRGQRFGFEVYVLAPPSFAIPNSRLNSADDFAGYHCSWLSRTNGRVVRKGRTLRMTFRPNGGLDERWPTWCPGTARIQLVRYPIAGNSSATETLAERTLPIALAPEENVPFERLPVKVSLLAGSSVTASASGRPDRSTPVTGVLRGTLDAPIAPIVKRDVRVAGLTGTLRPASFAPDPLCPEATPPATFDVAGSRLDVESGGPAAFALNINGAPSQIFGCGPPGALSGTTSLKLKGTFDLRTTALGSIALTGSTPGFDLPGGTQGGLAANLVVNVDLSGRG